MAKSLVEKEKPARRRLNRIAGCNGVSIRFLRFLICFHLSNQVLRRTGDQRRDIDLRGSQHVHRGCGEFCGGLLIEQLTEVGQKITKAALREMSDFFFQPFLLGIWHFAVVNRKDNTEGKSTYDIWCPSQGGKERKYAGTMGVGITRSINVTLIEVTGATPKQDPTSSVENSAPVENGDPVVEDFSEEPASTTTNQTINHPFVFHQYGNNSIQVGNIETLVINNSGGEKREQ